MTDERIDCDVLVSGGGIAGMVAAIACADAGFDTLCIDPAPPVTTADAPGSDLRSTAFLQPAQAFLDQIGMWERFAPFATPLQVMRIVDAAGDPPVARASYDFDAADLSDLPFGWNLPNWLLRRELLARIEASPRLRLKAGVGLEDLLTREAEARARLSDGRRVRARLVIGADGRGSAVREALGIDVSTARYGQKALAFAVSHDAPHHNISTEVHLSGGPFTLVPLPDHAGQHSSAVVWMDHGREVTRRAALPDAEFEAEMAARSAGLFGALRLISRRTVWPIISQRAERLVGQRAALVAEAAHVVPPIGAQGLNMSLGDIADLEGRIAGGDPGDQTALQAYERARLRDIALRVGGVDLLNRASMVGVAPVADLRARVLGMLHGAGPVRRGLMRAGLGARG